MMIISASNGGSKQVIDFVVLSAEMLSLSFAYLEILFAILGN